MIKVEHVRYSFMKGTPFFKQALDDVSFSIKEPSFVAVAGKSGCGKSTLLKLLGGIIEADQGNIEIQGLQLGERKWPAAKTASVVAMAFQNPEHQFFADTVREELLFGIHNIGKRTGKTEEEMEALLDLIGLDASYLSRSPFQLSGGEKRRVALASIFLMDTPVILLDEPTAGLDPVGKRQIAGMVKTMQKRGKTIFWVGHDLPEMAALADRLLVIAEGKVIFDDAPGKVLENDQLLKKAGLHFEAQDLGEVLRENYGISADSDEYVKIRNFYDGEEDSP